VADTESGLEETWENLSDADFNAFGDHLSASGCEMLDYSSENGLFNAAVGQSGKTYRFIYDASVKRATLIFPAGTYDESLYAVEQDYRRARAAMEAGEYAHACELLTGIRGYRDVDRICEADDNIRAAIWGVPGSIVTFGSYEQDNDAANGQEPIEWIVLSNDGDTSMLISRYALDCKPYNGKKTEVTWETSTLRKWLNGAFTDTAFSAEDQERIQTTQVPAGGNSRYSTDPGGDTRDKVFLLSIDEANTLFDGDAARQCKSTELAQVQGAYAVKNGNTWWWLRSPGSYSDYAASVFNDGSVNYSGINVNYVGSTVRPVVVLRLP